MVGLTYDFDNKPKKVATFQKKYLFSISAAIYMLVTHIIERCVRTKFFFNIYCRFDVLSCFVPRLAH